MTIKDKIISNGVKMLREYGYSGCDKNNILTDPIYSAFFKSPLEEAMESYPPNAKAAAQEIIEEINKNTKP